MKPIVKVLILAAATAAVSAPAVARAQGYISPFIGTNFGSHSGNGRTNIGVDAGWMSGGVIGAELDFGYAPNFFGSEGTFGSNSVTNLMGNLIVGVPLGDRHGAGIRPYATIGLGLLRTRVTGASFSGTQSFTDNEAGMSAGAGLMAHVSNHLGIRGDVRYLRNLRDSSAINDVNIDFGAFHFWRASIGVVLRP
jgi:opacity protein-like surface antigen